jgi:hypothetical protein
MKLLKTQLRKNFYININAIANRWDIKVILIIFSLRINFFDSRSFDFVRGKFQKSLLMIFIFTFVFACKESKVIEPSLMLKIRQIRINSPQIGPAQIINTLSYNQKLQSFFISVIPVLTNRKSIFSFPFKALDTKNLLSFANSFNVLGSNSGPIRNIKTSRDGVYTAIIGWNGHLIIIKDGLVYFDYNFQFDISSMAFGENLLALGNEKGLLFFLDLREKKVYESKKIIDGEITSIAWFKDKKFFVAGDGNQFFVAEGPIGKRLKSIGINSFFDKIISFSGIKHCYENRINKLLHIPSRKLLITSQGGDYCKNRLIKIWETDTWKLVHVIKDIKFQVHQMVSVPKFNEVILVDYNGNLWRFNLNNFNLSDPYELGESIYFFESHDRIANKEASKVFLGKVNSIVYIPQTDILVMALGSYFKGGAGILMTKLNNDSISHRFYADYFLGNFHLYISSTEKISIIKN